ncbi:MAG: uroporphyrinogen-III C-methyltransferase [Clostridiales bacterium]|nr:uroporphyrinogen-III C-methyltransferase [Clostridiales bacterium]
MQGTVYLIGAGLLNAGSISKRGLDLLLSADVVIFDRLVSPSILSRIPNGALLIDVGKPPKGGADGQTQIHALLEKYANEGKTVARLKSGDPFLFGRGGEECDFLRERGISFDVVAGVSSATGAAAGAGIPLTKRGGASAFAAATWVKAGGEKSRLTEPLCALLERGGTVEILMGAACLDEIEREFLGSGIKGETPCAVVSRSGAYDEKLILSPLLGLAEKAKNGGIEPPAAIIIGAAAAVEYTRPFRGKRIVLTRPFEKNIALFDRITGAGGEAVVCPMIEIRRKEISSELAAALKANTTHIAFSSAEGVESFWAAVERMGLDARAFSGIIFAAVGKKTAEGLKRHGITADIVAKKESAEGLSDALFGKAIDEKSHEKKQDFGGIERKKISVLYLRAKDGYDGLSARARECGASCTEIEAYETLPYKGVPQVLKILKKEGFSAAVFYSPSAVKNFVSEFSAELLSRVTAVCIGSATEKEAVGKGFLNVVVNGFSVDDDGIFKTLQNV